MRFRAAFLATIFLVVMGCSSDESGVPTHPVSGKVSFKGQPAAGAQIFFFFASEELRGQRIPVPQAVVDEKGGFQIGCYQDDDGAPAGEYRVAIIWEEDPADAPRNEDIDPPDRLRGRYSQPNVSGLSATIVEGDNKLPPFELE